MEPTSRTFEDLAKCVHKEGVTLFDYNNMKVPCVFVTNNRFDEIAKSCYGKPLRVDANLNIMHDGKKHVFVEMVLKFSAVGMEEKILLYANDNLEFFEHLAQTGIIGLAPEVSGSGSMNVFMLQLPRKDAVEGAVAMIKLNLK